MGPFRKILAKLARGLGRWAFVYFLAITIVFWLFDLDHALLNKANALKEYSVYPIRYVGGGEPFDRVRMRWALEYYKTLIRAVPKSSPFLGMAGFCYYYLGDFENSVRAYEMAMKYDAEGGVVFKYNLGVAYYQLEKYHESIAQLEDVVKDLARLFKQPEFWLPLDQEGDQTDEVLTYFVEHLVQTYENAHKVLVLNYFRLRDWGKIKKTSFEIHDAPFFEAQAFFFYYLGVAYVELGDYTNAIVALDHCRRKDPLFVSMYHYLRRAHAQLGHYAESEYFLGYAKHLEAQSSLDLLKKDLESPPELIVDYKSYEILFLKNNFGK